MNKKYTINNIEVTAEQIKDIIKNNPELVEEKVSGRYFFPKNGETYYVLLSTGDILNYVNDGDDTDKSVIELGVYRTKEEVELARDKQKAIVACWKWMDYLKRKKKLEFGENIDVTSGGEKLPRPLLDISEIIKEDIKPEQENKNQ